MKNKGLKHVAIFGEDPKYYSKEFPEITTYYLFVDNRRSGDFILSNIKEGNEYKLEYAKKQQYIKLPKISYDFMIGINEPYKFPALQNEFSQGRTNNGTFVWQGAETNEIFSWGPGLQNLEYDGTQYEYDKNGRFVNKGYGNGISPTYNDPLKFFKNGMTSNHKVRVYYSDENTKADLSFLTSLEDGIFKGSRKNENGFSSHLSKRFFYHLTPGIDFKINKEENNLMTEGPWLSKIIQSALLTPPGFDLYNGLKPNNSKLYKPQLMYVDQENDIQRSFAPNNFENPFWLVKNTIDENSFDRIFLNGFLKFNKNNFTAKISSSIDKQNNVTLYGIQEGTLSTLAGNLTERKEQVTNSFSNATLQYNYRNYHVTWKIMSTTDIGKNEKKLKIYNYNSANGVTTDAGNEQFSASRTWYNVGLHSDLNYEEIAGLSSKNSIYNSNTLNSDEKYLFSWSLGSYFNAAEIRGVSSYFLEQLKIRMQYGTSKNEQNFYSPFRYYNSLTFDTEDFSSIYRQDYASIYELQELKSEKHSKFNLGLDMAHFYNKLIWSVDFFSNTTRDLITPIWLSTTEPVLKNILDLKTTGAEIEFNIHYLNHYDINARSRISFTTLHQKVTAIHSETGEAYIPLSGFNDVFMAAVPGKAYGVIMGSSYLRNSSGELMIDEDGYPVVLNEPRIIGNPNPDFTLGFYHSISYRNFTFDFLFDIKKGGQKWNGTLNTLKYHGVAQASVDDRGIYNYIYDGINILTGNQNTQAVNFADPNDDVYEFKSVRNGVTGVAEDAIVDASWVRLKDISLNYNFSCGQFNNTNLFRINLTATIRNAFVISKYDGVDPETTLFGMDNTSGLDYFNLPNLRVYEFKVGISF